MTIDNIKTYGVSIGSISLIELAEILPSVVGFFIQTAIGILTIIYLFRQIKNSKKPKNGTGKPNG